MCGRSTALKFDVKDCTNATKEFGLIANLQMKLSLINYTCKCA